jgi:hypothetical protein
VRPLRFFHPVFPQKHSSQNGDDAAVLLLFPLHKNNAGVFTLVARPKAGPQSAATADSG